MRSRLLLTVPALTLAALFMSNEISAQPAQSTESNQQTEIEHPSLRVLMAQQDAWNNGDLDAFMQGYWQSDQLSFVGSESLTKGWDETLARYKARYPDAATMGKLKFEVIELRPLQTDFLWMIGVWTLERSEDRPSGHFSLLWQKIDGQWLIISDHSS
ncbi:YybH family protein [Umboniibacter marinipuniceus]|uniref:Ketosteroid isomerase-like protein n=1 Tax=Umboniibacter marinipuniceus TaxID=569599 RepID=A0A3M0A9E8_9GAMM|nr:nuclear transport factor 2 family protein [Umboniibacter marinipuniceus]RMA81236.1 ketosteroid isomerase-like protein [Umboniibacter marinipuniceus]